LVPKPYYERHGCTIYHGDYREILPTLGPVDLVLSDPPYGMKWNTDTARFSGGSDESKARRGVGKSNQARITEDDRPFDPSPWLPFPKVILWGCNHYAARLPVGTTLVWIKRSDRGFGTFLSDAEVAWMKGGHGVYCFRDLSLLLATRQRLHPNQKPLPLMRWCIEQAGEGVETILDPFMGSGSTLVAAYRLARLAIGIEIEERHCETAAKRLDRPQPPPGFNPTHTQPKKRDEHDDDKGFGLGSA